VPAYSPASLDAVRSQPEVDTHDDDEGRRRWVSARGNLWLTALNQLQPTCPVSGRQAELAPRLLDQGRNVAEYLAAHHARLRVLEWKALCWIYGWTRRLTVPGCLHCICGEAQGDTMEVACTACCTGCTI
jgi:hypothetical protein